MLVLLALTDHLKRQNTSIFMVVSLGGFSQGDTAYIIVKSLRSFLSSSTHWNEALESNDGGQAGGLCWKDIGGPESQVQESGHKRQRLQRVRANEVCGLLQMSIEPVTREGASNTVLPSLGPVSARVIFHAKRSLRTTGLMPITRHLSRQ